jgi:hypothetical protein
MSAVDQPPRSRYWVCRITDSSRSRSLEVAGSSPDRQVPAAPSIDLFGAIAAGERVSPMQAASALLLGTWCGTCKAALPEVLASSGSNTWGIDQSRASSRPILRQSSPTCFPMRFRLTNSAVRSRRTPGVTPSRSGQRRVKSAETATPRTIGLPIDLGCPTSRKGRRQRPTIARPTAARVRFRASLGVFPLESSFRGTLSLPQIFLTVEWALGNHRVPHLRREQKPSSRREADPFCCLSVGSVRARRELRCGAGRDSTGANNSGRGNCGDQLPYDACEFHFGLTWRGDCDLTRPAMARAPMLGRPLRAGQLRPSQAAAAIAETQRRRRCAADDVQLNKCVPRAGDRDVSEFWRRRRNRPPGRRLRPGHQIRLHGAGHVTCPEVHRKRPSPSPDDLRPNGFVPRQTEIVRIPRDLRRRRCQLSRRCLQPDDTPCNDNSPVPITTVLPRGWCRHGDLDAPRLCSLL